MMNVGICYNNENYDRMGGIIMTEKTLQRWKFAAVFCAFLWLGAVLIRVFSTFVLRSVLWCVLIAFTVVLIDGWCWQARKKSRRAIVWTALMVVVTVIGMALGVLGFSKETVEENGGPAVLVREDFFGNEQRFFYKNAFVYSTEDLENSVQGPSDLQVEAPLSPLSLSVQTNSAGERVFNVVLEDIINSYNGYYYDVHGCSYIRKQEFWQKERQPAGMHFNEECDVYTYCMDFSKWTLPRMSAYCSTIDGQLREFICNYDDHSYSPESFALYEEMCANALRVFVPALSEKEAKEWATHINKVGDENTFNSDKQYRSADMKPTDLFVHDDVGVFSYVAIGAPLNFCVIPLDDALVQMYQDASVRVHKLS